MRLGVGRNASSAVCDFVRHLGLFLREMWFVDCSHKKKRGWVGFIYNKVPLIYIRFLQYNKVVNWPHLVCDNINKYQGLNLFSKYGSVMRKLVMEDNSHCDVCPYGVNVTKYVAICSLPQRSPVHKAWNICSYFTRDRFLDILQSLMLITITFIRLKGSSSPTTT